MNDAPLDKEVAFARHMKLWEVTRFTATFKDLRYKRTWWRVEYGGVGVYPRVLKGVRKKKDVFVWKNGSIAHAKTLAALAYPYFVPGEANEYQRFD